MTTAPQTCQQTTASLLPCPFCGGDGLILIGQHNFDDAQVSCANCCMCGPNFDRDPQIGAVCDDPIASAITHWNTRSPTSNERAAVSTGEPVAWVARHRDGDLAWHTFNPSEQAATASLMRKGIAGNHGWGIVPLYALPPAKTAGDVRAAVIEECAKVVEDFPYKMLHMWERPGGPPGNGYRETTHEDISAALRALSQSPATDAPGGQQQ